MQFVMSKLESLNFNYIILLKTDLKPLLHNRYLSSCATGNISF
jgi:hypothetical protein